VVTDTGPDTPAEPDAAVDTVTLPLLKDPDPPLDTITSPPDANSDAPPDTSTRPPEPVVP